MKLEMYEAIATSNKSMKIDGWYVTPASAKKVTFITKTLRRNHLKIFKDYVETQTPMMTIALASDLIRRINAQRRLSNIRHPLRDWIK